MVNRPCLVCGKLSPNTRCETHRKQHDNTRYARRGTSTQRGYGHAYRVRRAEMVKTATHCAKCGQPFTPDNPPTGGHVDDLRSLPRHLRRASAATAELQPEHQRCNYGWSRSGSNQQ
jgi:hypothetical protein